MTRIYCPRCAWAPSAEDRWECRPGCRTLWNTFETAARCPGCSKRWLVTVCLQCAQGSLHEHWYHDEATDAWQDAAAEDEALVETGGGSGGWPATAPGAAR